MKMRLKAKIYSILVLAFLMPGIGYALLTTTTGQNTATTTTTSTQTQAIGQPAPCQFPPCAPPPGQAVVTPAGTLAPTLAVVNPGGSLPASSVPISAPAAVSGGTPAGTSLGSPPAGVGSGTVVSSGPVVGGGPGVVVPGGVAQQTVEQTRVTTTGPVVLEEEYVVPMADPVTYRQIRELMIYESNLIHGECVCPYSPDRIGGQCGSESQYYKPHSDKIYCYMSDISNNDVHFYWLKNGIGLPDY